MPITLNLHYLIPLSSKLKIGISAGAGYYLTTLKYNYASEFGIGAQRGTETYAFQAQKGAIGCQGGLGLEFAVSGRLSIVLNANGRYARSARSKTGHGAAAAAAVSASSAPAAAMTLSGFTIGCRTARHTAGWHFRISPRPGMQGMSNVRKARLDLTGASVTLGFKIGIGRI